MKPRPESLYARLATADPSLALREWVFYAAIVEGKGLEEIGGTLADKGVQTSAQAISKMLSRWTLTWKVQQSRDTAHQLDRALTPKEARAIPDRIKKNLRLQLFNASMENLTVKEMVSLHRAQLAERSLDIQLYDLQAECAAIIGEVLRGGARAAALQELAADKGLTGREFVEAVRHRVYGEMAAEVPEVEGGAA